VALATAASWAALQGGRCYGGDPSWASFSFFFLFWTVLASVLQGRLVRSIMGDLWCFVVLVMGWFDECMQTIGAVVCDFGNGRGYGLIHG
jgi:hypothetical protein